MLGHPYRDPPPTPPKRPGKYHGRVIVYSSFGMVEEHYVGAFKSLTWAAIRTKLKAMILDYFVIPNCGVGIDWQVGWFEDGNEPSCAKEST